MVVRSLLKDKSGNVAISAAFMLPIVVLTLGIGVDYGYLTLQKREIQGIADLTAIVVSSDLNNAETNALTHFKNNGLMIAVDTKDGLKTPDGKTVTRSAAVLQNGIATIKRGRYIPDPTIDAGKRFVADATPADAAQVEIARTGTLQLASMFASAPTMSAVGTAATTKLASYSIGSRLASLDGGVLNALLGQMLGTSLTLKAMDYNALLAADVNVQPFLKIIATRLNLTAANYNDVLNAKLTMPQLLASMQLVQGLSATTTAALKALETATAKNKNTFTLSQLLNIDPKKAVSLDAGSNWDMKVSAFDILSAAAGISNGTNQISLDAVAGLPGIASTTVKLAIGEPPVESPSNKLGQPGSIVRTAQTRLAIEVTIDGLAALAGLKIKLPLYVEVAYAEGKLSDIKCYGGSTKNAGVTVDAAPGVAQIAIGTVNSSAFSNFGTTPRVDKARILDSLLVRIDGIANVETKNMIPQSLAFSPSEIASGTVKNVSTKDILTSTTQTLLNNLNVEIQVLMLTIGTPQVIQSALAQTLGLVTPAVDTLLYNILTAVGVKVGEADVRVTGVNCLQPVLVQ